VYRARLSAKGIADALGLTPVKHEHYADVLGRAADDTILEVACRQCIEALLGASVPTRRRLRLALDVGELLDRIRATGRLDPRSTAASRAIEG
jgi:hypothetical protein